MSRSRRLALRSCLDAGVRSASAIYREEEGDLEREIKERREKLGVRERENLERERREKFRRERERLNRREREKLNRRERAFEQERESLNRREREKGQGAAAPLLTHRGLEAPWPGEAAGRRRGA